MDQPAIDELFLSSSLEILALSDLQDRHDIQTIQAATPRIQLYIEETASIYVVLTLGECDSAGAAVIAKHSHGQLDLVTLDTKEELAKNGIAMARQSSSRNHKEDSILATHGLSKADLQLQEHNGVFYIFWALKTFIPPPRTRSSTTRISFNVQLHLSAAALSGGYVPDEAERDTTPNLLRSLQSDIYLAKSAPSLLSSKVSTIPSAASTKSTRLRKAGKRVFDCQSVISIQARNTQSTGRDIIFLHLTMDTAQGIESVTIENIDLSIKHTRMRLISAHEPPFTLTSTDSISIAYEITLDTKYHTTSLEGPLTIQLTPLRGPRITSSNQFTIPITLNSPEAKVVRTSRRPGSSALSGLLISINAPDIVSQTTELKVAVLVKNQSTTHKVLAVEVSRKKLPVMPGEKTQDRLLPLVTSVRLPILQVGGTQECEVRFKAMSQGRTRIPEIRVIEISTGQAYEMRDMPECIIVA